MVRILQTGGGGGAPAPAPCETLGYCWAWYKPITIAAGKVPSTQTNCPMVIDLADLGADFFAAIKADGSDIRVTLPDKTLIPTELETIDTVANTGILHCKPPTLASLDLLRVYYDNPLAGILGPGDTIGSQAVWDANFAMVQHLPNGAVLTANDSTVNANNGTVNGGVTATPGQVDGAGAFDGTGYIEIPGLVLTQTDNWTMELWTKPTDLTLGNRLGLYIGGSGTDGYGIATSGSLAGRIGALYGGVGWEDTNSSYILNAQHYIMAVRSGGTLTIYLNGVALAPTSIAGITVPAGVTQIGWGAANNKALGVLDEARISNVPRSVDYAITQYNNQSSPSTFYTVGAAVAA